MSEAPTASTAGELVPTSNGTAFDDRRLVFYALLTGLCPLIPAPFVDDWARDRLRRRLVDELAIELGPVLTQDERNHLACGPSQTLTGCLQGCATGAPFKIAFYVISKLFRSTFRKIFIFLAIKDAADTFSRTLHEGHLLRHVVENRVVESRVIESRVVENRLIDGKPERVATIRSALVGACDAVDTRSVRHVARGVMGSGRAVLKKAARLLGGSRVARRRGGSGDGETLDREEALLGDLVDDLTQELDRTLAANPNYWSNLRREFDRRLANPSEVAPPVSSSDSLSS